MRYIDMSLAYCSNCLIRIDNCNCEQDGDPPYIYGEIELAIEEYKKRYNCQCDKD